MVPQHPSVPVTLLLPPPSRLPKLRKPRPVPSLGQCLVIIPTSLSVSASLSLVETPRLVATPEQPLPSVVTIPRKALVLRPVQFPMEVITPGTKLYSPPKQILTAVKVLLMEPSSPISEPHVEMTQSVTSIIIVITTTTVTPTQNLNSLDCCAQSFRV